MGFYMIVTQHAMLEAESHDDNIIEPNMTNSNRSVLPITLAVYYNLDAAADYRSLVWIR